MIYVKYKIFAKFQINILTFIFREILETHFVHTVVVGGLSYLDVLLALVQGFSPTRNLLNSWQAGCLTAGDRVW
jgi:hypothetical protein